MAGETTAIIVLMRMIMNPKLSLTGEVSINSVSMLGIWNPT